jgi:hypothetical protein
LPLHPTVRKKKYQAMQILCFKTCLLGYFIESMNDVDKQMALDRLRFQNVQFLICGNTLLAYPVKRQDFYEVAERTWYKLDYQPSSLYSKQGIFMCDHNQAI